MYIFKNAILSIKRNKGRNLLIGVIFIVIACAIAVSLAIRNSANTLINSYEDSYEITASIGMDRKNFMDGFDPTSDSMDEKIDEYNDIESITVEDIENYGDSKYVTDYYYTNKTSLNSDDIEKVTSTRSDDDSSKKGFGGMSNPQETSSADFTLTGYSSINAMSDFIEGNYTITDGAVSTNFESTDILINEELASANDLSVGDTITFVNPDNKKLTYELTIVGIYSDNTESNDSRMSMFSNSANTIITNTTVIEQILNDDEELESRVTPTFILTGKDVITDFENELKEKGMSEYFSVSTNLDQIEGETASITNVKTFATTFLIITLIIGGIVLFVLNMINVRERKYEIGVLRTIGMKKSALASQFIIEILSISMLSLVIGTAVGSLISVPVANNLLASEIESSKNSYNEIENNFGAPGEFDKSKINKFNGVVSVDKITSIKAVVDIKVIIELIGLGIVLSFISSLASMINIQRFSPLTILKERS